MKRINVSCWVLMMLAGVAPVARGQVDPAHDWPQWRGPQLDGHSPETGIPVKWSGSENVAWKVPIPGRGHSSPIVCGQRIFLTTCLEEQTRRELLCIDRGDGKILWEKTVVVSPLEQKNKLNNYASATPATDGRHVYVTFLKDPEVHVVCFDYDGNEVWRTIPGTFKSKHGWATAPILYKDLVLVNCDHDAPAGTDAFLVALEQSTGKERWRTVRPNRTRSYCNPLIIQAAGKTQMVLTGSKCTASYDPDTGKQNWIIDGPTEQFVASPVLADGVVFITGGFPTFHAMGIDPSGNGNVSASHVLWHETKHGTYVPSPIAFGDWFFYVSDQGREGDAFCLDAKTGKQLWTAKLGKHHRPSPVCAEGRLYFLADDGETFVIKAAPQFELISTNAIGEECFASPAISRGQIFIRSVSSLFCIGKK